MGEPSERDSRFLSLICTSVVETLRVVSKAADKGSAVFSDGLAKPVMDDWLLLEAEPATSAYIELEAALAAVESATQAYTGVELEVVNTLEQLLAEHSMSSYAGYLERSRNAISYSLATIDQAPDLTVRAHAGRSGSARRQLTGIAKMSAELLACVEKYARD
jgi:hypothetical protein